MQCRRIPIVYADLHFFNSTYASFYHGGVYESVAVSVLSVCLSADRTGRVETHRLPCPVTKNTVNDCRNALEFFVSVICIIDWRIQYIIIIIIIIIIIVTYLLYLLITYLHTHLLTYLLTYLLNYLLTYLVSYSLTHLLTYSHTHLLTYLPTY